MVLLIEAHKTPKTPLHSHTTTPSTRIYAAIILVPFSELHSFITWLVQNWKPNLTLYQHPFVSASIHLPNFPFPYLINTMTLELQDYAQLKIARHGKPDSPGSNSSYLFIRLYVSLQIDCRSKQWGFAHSFVGFHLKLQSTLVASTVDNMRYLHSEDMVQSWMDWRQLVWGKMIGVML